MNCENARRLIDAYMDSELEPRTAMEIEGHLAECVPCHRLLEARQELSRAIKRAAVMVAAPSGLGLQLKRRTYGKPKLRFGLASTALAFAVGTTMVLAMWRPWAGKDDGEARLVQDLMTDHRNALKAHHWSDSGSNEPKNVVAWFCKKVGYSPSVMAIPDHKFDLVGGRVDLVRGQTVPVLVYSTKELTIDVFVTPGSEIDATSSDLDGIHVRSWVNCGLSYWAVSSGPMEDLLYLRQALIGR